MKAEFMERIKGARFETVRGFYVRREEIKRVYRGLRRDEQEIYKWYYYNQMSLVKYKSKRSKKYIKEVMWGYVNDVESEEEVESIYREFEEYSRGLTHKN